MNEMNETVLKFLEAAEENCRINGGDWYGWENAQHLISTYADTLGKVPETAVLELESALAELKKYEDSIEPVLTGNGIQHLVRVETLDAEIWLYKTAWDAWQDRDGSKPWLPCGRAAW
jgi:hypothetical protein